MSKAQVYHEANVALHHEWVALQQEPEGPSKAVRCEELASRVILQNEKLLGNAVNTYTRHNSVIEDDLMNVARANLWRAFKIWDPEKAPLASAAMPYISGAVRREVNAQEYPHLSYEQFTLRGKSLKMIREFEAEHDREPTLVELSALVEATPEKLSLVFSPKTSSLDQPVTGDEGDASLGSLLDYSYPAEELEGAEPGFQGLEFSEEYAASLDPYQVFVYYMMNPGDLGVSSRSYEVSHLWPAPDGYSTVTKDLQDISLGNAFYKIHEVSGRYPNADQLSVACSVSREVAARWLSNLEVV